MGCQSCRCPDYTQYGGRLLNSSHSEMKTPNDECLFPKIIIIRSREIIHLAV